MYGCTMKTTASSAKALFYNLCTSSLRTTWNGQDKKEETQAKQHPMSSCLNSNVRCHTEFSKDLSEALAANTIQKRKTRGK